MSRELHIVGFQVGRETYGVPITSLHEIVRVPEITAVPDAPDYMEGVINLRGKIVSVIDLRKRFGEKEAAHNRRNRILVVEHNGRLSGLIVDSASEVLKIPAAMWSLARRISGRRTELRDRPGQVQGPPDRSAGYDTSARFQRELRRSELRMQEAATQLRQAEARSAAAVRREITATIGNA